MAKAKPSSNLNPDFARFCKLDAQTRADLFEQEAESLQTIGQSVEKDFWVCRVIDALFHGLPTRPKLYFRGGTSLSKGFNLINRFSEDIDLTISPMGLGRPGTVKRERDPSRLDASPSKIRKNIEFVAPLAQSHVERSIAPRLQALLPDCEVRLNSEPSDQKGSEIEIEYEPVLPTRGSPWVLVESGIRLGREPDQRVEIMAYCQSAISANKLKYNLKTGPITVISPARTMWEKCMLMHQINNKTHRAVDRGDFNKLSRHYYDVAKIAASDLGEKALGDCALMERTRQLAKLSGRLNAGQLDLAVPGTIRLAPPADLHGKLEADYTAMEGMMFGKPPPFADVCEELSKFERRLKTAREEQNA
jgi:hypothetical protein